MNPPNPIANPLHGQGNLLVLFLLFQVIIWLIYSAGSPARWMFDDEPNLGPLGNIHDFQTALEFIVGGISSQIGRPLAMATFLLQLDAWPNNPTAFRQFNALIHLVNGTLVALLAWLIARRYWSTRNKAVQVALVVACLWLAHPLLASSVLSAVQRMTLLAALFMLAGLVAYVHGRSLAAHHPVRALVWMTSGIVLGTGLGVLAKENASLLPLLAAVLEFTLLRAWPSAISTRVMRLWRIGFLALPTLLLAGYLLLNWQGHAYGYLHRSFSFSERLATEVVILWDYVRQMLMPDVTRLGLFHDDITVRNPTDGIVIVAAVGWLVVVAGAWLLRRRKPLASFAVLWFLANHLLESTALPLELYFEHRNYLAILGPLGALVAAAWAAGTTTPLPRLLPLLAIPLSATLLWSVTSLWGNPTLAAEMWYQVHPRSSRATQFIAQQYLLNKDPDSVTRIIREATAANPLASDIALYAIQLECFDSDAEKMQALYADVLARSPTFHSSYAAAETIHKIASLIEENDCPNMNRHQLARLIEALLANDAMRSNGLIRHHLNSALGVLYLREGDWASAITHLDQAFSAQPNPDTAILIAGMLAGARSVDLAFKSLDEAMKQAPSSRLKRMVWERKINDFRNRLVQGGFAPASAD